MASYSKNDGVKTLAITSTVSINDFDTVDLRTALLAVDSLKPAVALSGSTMTLTLNDGRVIYCTFTGTAFALVFGASAATSYTLTAAGNANGVYTGTISVTANSLKGLRVTIAGFTTGANNGAFMVTANNGSTTITTTNTSSATESHAGTASLGTITADSWTASDLSNMLIFIRAAAAAITAYTATVFTVTYA